MKLFKGDYMARKKMHQGIFFIFAVLFMMVLIIPPVTAEGFLITINNQSVSTGSQTVIPIHITNSEELGEMNIEVTFDPLVLQFSNVDLGDISKNGIIEATETRPGTIVINFVDNAGISQDGDLLNLKFDVIGNGGTSSTVSITPKGIYNLDKKDIPTGSSSGKIMVTGGGGEKTPVSVYIPFIALTILIFIAIRRRYQ
jgi:hypothetical protein